MSVDLTSTFNLFWLTYMLSSELRQTREGSATGGSTTTTIDTAVLSQYEDDYFNYNDLGTVWIIEDAGGAGAAPQGEFARVTNFVSTTSTLTHEAVTVDVAAGDRYALADDTFPLNQLIHGINNALRDVGVMTFEDTTTVQIDTEQTEYTLPFMPGGKLLQVWEQTVTNDANDNRWRKCPKSAWYVAETGIGTAKKLIFNYQYPEDSYMKLVYTSNHPVLSASTDEVWEGIPLKNILYTAAVEVLRWKKQELDTEKYDTELIKYEDLTLRLNPVDLPQEEYASWDLGLGRQQIYTEPNKVVI